MFGASSDLASVMEFGFNSAFYRMRQNVSRVTVIVIVIKRVQQLHTRWTNSSCWTLRHHQQTPYVSSQAVSTRHNRLSRKRGFTELRRRLIRAIFARFICLLLSRT